MFPLFGLDKVKIIETVLAVAAPVIVCVFIAWHFYGTGHDDATSVLQPKIDVLTQTVQTDDASIKQLLDEKQINDNLLVQYEDTISLLRKKSSDDETAIHRLQANDKDVDAYLGAPIPDALRSLLNDEPGPATGDQGSAIVAPEGAGVSLPAPAR